MCDNRCRHLRGVHTAGSYEVAGVAAEGVEAFAGWKKWLTAGLGERLGKGFGILYITLFYLGEKNLRIEEIRESQT